MTNLGFNFDNSYARLPTGFFRRLDPVPVGAPSLVLLNDGLADEMGLDTQGRDPAELAPLFAGNALPQGAEPLAQAYAGHQFGHFTMLGDGRAIVWGEHLTPGGARLDIQYKGSGPTPFSRSGDGRAALGPMLREYAISEAMHALGIPTTRSLAVAATGEQVLRETALPGAVLTRVARSHLRVGTFQYAAALQDIDLLRALVDYALDRHDPHLKDAESPALALLEAVLDRQVDLIVQWMRVGFIHGVMNTDNMTIAGETIDYGPCAFMDAYDPATVFSSIDRQGRYAFANQPVIAQWNLARLAEALLPLVDPDFDTAVQRVEPIIDGFTVKFRDAWLAMMRAKLGLLDVRDADQALITDLLDWMQQAGADHTNTFRALSRGAVPTGGAYDSLPFKSWAQRWQAHGGGASAESVALMRATNPAVIPRNHLVEHALDAATAGDLAPFNALLQVLADPYADRPADDLYTQPAPPTQRVYQTFCGT